MKRREFLKAALLGAGLCLTGETAVRQVIGATPAVEPPKSAGKYIVYRYVRNESEKCYSLATTDAYGNLIYLSDDNFRSYDTHTSFEKCGTLVHIPTTMTNRTTLDTHQLDSLYPAVAVR